MKQRKITEKDIFDQLHQDLTEAFNNPDHPVFDQLREYLVWNRQLLMLIDIPL